MSIEASPDEILETGYGATAPDGDNLCNDYVRGMVRGFTRLAEARGDRVRVDDLVACGDGGSPTVFRNFAILVRPVGADELGALATACDEFFGAAEGGPALVFSAWPTPDLVPWGFGRVGHPPLMLRMPGGPLPAPPDGLEIVEVQDAATCVDWETVMVDGYPLPELAPATPGCLLPEPALAAPGWRHWVGYLDGRPVACSSAVVGEHHVDVENIAALEETRGRGVGRAITAVATAANPDLPAMLISSDLGRPVYERLGYRNLMRFTLWIWPRGR